MDSQNSDSSPSLVTYGKSVLIAAASAIETLADSLGEPFAEAVSQLAHRSLTGRIVISGMGKAGYIGMKLSATLASIGYPSFFLHPADAIHGDLGRVSNLDSIVLLSNSGETSEIVRLLPRLKEFGVFIVAITCSKTTSLGAHSDIVIEIGKVSEAGPLGLAPTTSTSVMLALSDALAMTLIHARGFTREEFATFHPGGDLGRALLTVKDIMRSGDSHCVVPSSVSTRETLRAINLTKGRPGAAAIVNESGILVGIFTDGDLRRCLDSSDDFLNRPVVEFASSSPKTVYSTQLASDAARIISSAGVDQVIVVDEGKTPIGLVDIQDLLSHGMLRSTTG